MPESALIITRLLFLQSLEQSRNYHPRLGTGSLFWGDLWPPQGGERVGRICGMRVKLGRSGTPPWLVENKGLRAVCGRPVLHSSLPESVFPTPVSSAQGSEPGCDMDGLLG